MKQIFTLLLSFFLISTYAQTCAGRYQTEIYNQVDVSTVDFGSAPNTLGDTVILKMDIYEAVGDTSTNRPVVIFCFGGSFWAGSRTENNLVSLATSFAKRGFLCASIDYRLAGSILELGTEESMVKIVFNAVQDGKAAIRYFRKDFDEGNSLGIDPDNIFIGGTSAGGILAVNLAYVDSIGKLPSTWQEWSTEVGGLEGSSGNPGYCSYPNGVFGFAPAVGDTSFINANDVPFYSCHATGDQTVQYGFGTPLGGLAPVTLYGSGNIETRMANLGIYHRVDTYTGGDHPPLNTQQRMDDTRDNLGEFLYNILDCNVVNLKMSNQQSCADFYTTVGIRTVNEDKDWSIYPNPTNSFLTISGTSDFESFKILDAMGRELMSSTLQNTNQITVDVQDFASGMYFVYVQSAGVWRSEKLLIK